ncbi:MAG TPA: hypothetical protein VD994_10235, partial [Prosthecobacter sp.]|nr:hypothetical protein [Prosthecobacter sp.]
MLTRAAALCFCLCSGLCLLHGEEEIEWLIQYDGRSVPAAPWTAVGEPMATVEAEGLRLSDDSAGFGHFRMPWKMPGADQEIVVEAKVKVGAVTGSRKDKPATSLWPWRDGAPVALLVSDGRHQEGLVLFPAQAATFTDRFVPMDTTNRFHTYRLVIRGTDMSLWVDGEQKVEGQNAFWKPAASPEPFIQFGSSAKTATGEAVWSSLKLGVRKMSAPAMRGPLKVTIGKPWDIPREVKQNRPYVYNLGQGLLLMSVAQGPDAFYEPYGLLKSTDAGQTWTPVPGLDQKDITPLPVLRRPDGTILAASRWTWLQPDGSILGKTFHLNADATAFTMTDSRIHLPKEYSNETKADQIIVERHIWNDEDGGATMVLWSRKNVKMADGRNSTVRWSHLVKTTDNGLTWNYVATIGPGGEPAVARFSATELTAVIRGDRNSRLKQTFSHDG